MNFAVGKWGKDDVEIDTTKPPIDYFQNDSF